MTKKHFEALAEALALLPPTFSKGVCVAKIASVCAAANKNFDRQRFIEAANAWPSETRP